MGQRAPKPKSKTADVYEFIGEPLGPLTHTRLINDAALLFSVYRARRLLVLLAGRSGFSIMSFPHRYDDAKAWVGG